MRSPLFLTSAHELAERFTSASERAKHHHGSWNFAMHLQQRHHVDFAVEEIVIVELHRVRAEPWSGRCRSSSSRSALGSAILPRYMVATPQKVQRKRQPRAAWYPAVRAPR